MDLTVLSQASSLIECVNQGANASAGRTVLAIGDSTTAGGQWVQKVLDLAAATAASVQPTFIGTQGTGSAKHEGHSGYTVADYYNPTGAVTNPFSISGSAFDFSGYLTANSLATPDIVAIHLGINDAFGAADDAAALTAAEGSISMLDAMIGLTSVAGITTMRSVNADLKVIICLPIAPTMDQGGFGSAYGEGQYARRYLRNHLIYVKALIDHYAALESAGVFLLDWNAHVDMRYGFGYIDTPANDIIAGSITTAATYAVQVADLSPADGAIYLCTDLSVAPYNKYIVKVGPSGKGFYRQADEREGIIRQADNGVHPFKTPGGYQEMGTSMSYCLNVLVAKGWA